MEPTKLAKKYIVLQDIKTCTNVVVHQKGEALNGLTVGTWSGLFGSDRMNKFYTGEFLDSHPQTFQRIEHYGA